MTLEHVKNQLQKYASSGTNVDDIIYEDSEFNFGHQLAEEFLFKITSDKYPLVSTMKNSINCLTHKI